MQEAEQEESHSTSADSAGPIVSIVTPVRNGARFIDECIASVMQQTYSRVEHVIVDGASDDGTQTIVASWQERFPGRIITISEPDDGVGDAWNKGFALARGDIIGWLGMDDILSDPLSIEAVVNFFGVKPDAQFVYGGCNRVNERGEVVATILAKPLKFKELLLGRNPIAACSAFYRRQVINEVGWFGLDGNDFDYWLRVASRYQIHALDRVLSHFRERDDSASGSIETYYSRVTDDFRVVRRHGGKLLSSATGRLYMVLTLLERLGLGRVWRAALRRRRARRAAAAVSRTNPGSSQEDLDEGMRNKGGSSAK